VDVDVAVDAHPCVEELWELGPGVTERRHHRLRALRPRLGKVEPSEASLSRTSPHHPPNLVEVMVIQTQLMQRMAEAKEHRGNGGNRVAPQEEDLTRKIEMFIV
jgi:hypothetical protein